MNPEMAMVARRNEEVETLRGVIQQWNANRLDLFELSEPNEVSLVHSVYFFISLLSLFFIHNFIRSYIHTYPVKNSRVKSGMQPNPESIFIWLLFHPSPYPLLSPTPSFLSAPSAIHRFFSLISYSFEWLGGGVGWWYITLF